MLPKRPAYSGDDGNGSSGEGVSSTAGARKSSERVLDSGLREALGIG